ncbi:MAG TPA: helix-turn-helix domain-containing protein [Bryobacteraceae bacterium]|nr:helix-turn-helix domain-containing protein [Bryobacteraceae bacterium]
MESVGSLLRGERTRQGRDIAEIAATLCITQAYLHAIEADDLTPLPGIFFYKSFVKQYARLLGVPDSSIQPGIAALTAPAPEPPLPWQDQRYSPSESAFPGDWAGELRKLLHGFDSSHAPAPQDASRQDSPMGVLDPVVESTNRSFSGHRLGASVTGLVAVLLFCSGFYAWWNRAPRTEPVQATTAGGPARATPVQTVSAGSPGAASSTPSISVTTSQTADGHAVLNLSAIDEVWISVTANGKEVFSGVLKPSQTKTLTGIEAAQMKVGNAGGLDVSWNGKPIGPIGPRGQVRTVVLTPESFEVLPPKPVLDDTL